MHFVIETRLLIITMIIININYLLLNEYIMSITD